VTTAVETGAQDTLDYRQEIARYVLSLGIEESDLEMEPDLTLLPEAIVETLRLNIGFPAGLEPKPQPIEPAPATSAALPRADVAVITWTVAEQNALADVMTPSFGRARWYRYDKGYAAYEPKIRMGAPARNARRLGSYFPTKIGSKKVLCFKSELHLNQDGVATGTGTATLPVKDLFKQIIAETGASHVLTIGTSGGVFAEFELGDVAVTRAAKFRCRKEFRNEPFNNQVYKSDWEIPTKHFDTATQLMAAFADDLTEPPLGPPTKRYPFQGPLVEPPANTPDIKLDGRDMPEFHPILTTDYFEYGTSANRLDKEGAAVEMGDAALGLACAELDDPPKWAVLRNMSDPVINGDLPTKPYHLNEQTMWAVGYYTAYGYYTSVTGALATWAVIAGLDG
jgi:hypothetical protein